MAYSFMVQSLTPGLSPGGKRGKKKVAFHHQQETEVYLGELPLNKTIHLKIYLLEYS